MKIQLRIYWRIWIASGIKIKQGSGSIKPIGIFGSANASVGKMTGA
jgi:hypothetical protein